MSDYFRLIILVVGPAISVLSLCMLLGMHWGRPGPRGFSLLDVWNYYRSLLEVDPQALHKQPLLWFALLLPISYGICVSVPFLQGREPDLSAEGIAVFFNAVQYGVYIISVALPLGLLIARMHSTVQVEAQLEASRAQNVFTNFFKHREVVRDEVDSICTKFHLYPNRRVDIYKLLFPDNNPNTMVSTSINSDVISVIKKRISEVDECLEMSAGVNEKGEATGRGHVDFEMAVNNIAYSAALQPEILKAPELNWTAENQISLKKRISYLDEALQAVMEGYAALSRIGS